jgi:hypothetical protein
VVGDNDVIAIIYNKKFRIWYAACEGDKKMHKNYSQESGWVETIRGTCKSKWELSEY